jgi:hypothetical protein
MPQTCSAHLFFLWTLSRRLFNVNNWKSSRNFLAGREVTSKRWWDWNWVSSKKTVRSRGCWERRFWTRKPASLDTIKVAKGGEPCYQTASPCAASFPFVTLWDTRKEGHLSVSWSTQAVLKNLPGSSLHIGNPWLRVEHHKFATQQFVTENRTAWHSEFTKSIYMVLTWFWLTFCGYLSTGVLVANRLPFNSKSCPSVSHN